MSTAAINGQTLDRTYLTMKEFLEGSELVLTMSSDTEPNPAEISRVRNGEIAFGIDVTGL